jgi:hypothetical protein
MDKPDVAGMNDMAPGADVNAALMIPIKAYVSEAYARAEIEKLWGKVWQIACRAEELGCEPLREFLEPATTMLGPFELDKG